MAQRRRTNSPDSAGERLVQWAGNPRATLAIIFTDILDSTATARTLGDEAMRRVLESHSARSHQLIADHAGRWIKSLGDGDLAVFRYNWSNPPVLAHRATNRPRDTAALY